MSLMDYGHYNCRDYYISPPVNHAARNIGTRVSLARHESWEELEHRSRSPASIKPKFPLLRLPLELRRQIYTYLLPQTQEHASTESFAAPRGKNGSPVKRTEPRCSASSSPSHKIDSAIPSPSPSKRSFSTTASNVVWHRGNVSLLRVCKQLHDEGTDMLYGSNTFLLAITYKGIAFRFRWSLPSGLTPTTNISDFLDRFPRRYTRRLKSLVVDIDHVDSYTGMTKFNVSGKGLTHGMQRQVQRLVNALSSDTLARPPTDVPFRRLTRLRIRVCNGSGRVEAWKRDRLGHHTDPANDPQHIWEMLSPLAQLHAIHDVRIEGAVTDDLAYFLEHAMSSTAPPVACDSRIIDAEDGGMQAPQPGIQICVYGNDI